MKTAHAIYEDGDHKWLAMVRDDTRPGFLIDTNEYLVTSDGDAILLDPGGSEVFPAVFSAVSTGFDPRRIQKIFASHQDPDVISSLSMWLEFNPGIKCYLSWLWQSFVPHFAGQADTFVTIPDGGMDIVVGSVRLQAIPAHYLHSSGNLHLYDPKAKILFPGTWARLCCLQEKTACLSRISTGTFAMPKPFTGAGWGRTRPSATGAPASRR